MICDLGGAHSLFPLNLNVWKHFKEKKFKWNLELDIIDFFSNSNICDISTFVLTPNSEFVNPPISFSISSGDTGYDFGKGSNCQTKSTEQSVKVYIR